MSKPYHIVFTTIHLPAVVEELYVNLKRYDWLGLVKVWIIGDKKTPAACAQLAESTTDKGLETVYADITTQDKWGERIADFYQQLPYNNETRRNIGFLMALEDGCELLISIDDDNFPTEDDFIGSHLTTGTRLPQQLIHEASGFHNVCEYLQITPDRHIFPRGYPFKLRGAWNKPQRQEAPESGTIGVTAGLWLSAPDIDATTWLNGTVESTAYQGSNSQVLAQNTWTPINTQNTSVVRELLPAYLCIPMGWDLPGGIIQRYGDIWGGYFLQALIQNSTYHVAFGRPIVDHRRNPHDYLDDLRAEYWGMMLTDWLIEQLRDNFRPHADDMITRVEELADFMQCLAQGELPSWSPQAVREFLLWTATNQKLWAQACRTIILQ